MKLRFFDWSSCNSPEFESLAKDAKTVLGELVPLSNRSYHQDETCNLTDATGWWFLFRKVLWWPIVFLIGIMTMITLVWSGLRSAEVADLIKSYIFVTIGMSLITIIATAVWWGAYIQDRRRFAQETLTRIKEIDNN